MKSRPDPIRPAPYQLVPLAKLLANGLDGLLIGDGVGAGKTISAGYVLTYARSKLAKPAFVVCSPTLIFKWIFELKSKFNTSALPVRSMDDLDTAKDESSHRSHDAKQPVYVMSNSLLSKARQTDYPTVSAAIFDEVHTYRNPQTEWQRGCLELARSADIRVGLSATPINNQMQDLVSEFCVLLPKYDLETIEAVVNDLWSSNRDALSGALVTRFLKDRLGIHFARRVVESILVSYPEPYLREATSAILRQTSGRTLLEKITYYRLAASSPWAFWTSIGRKDLRDQWIDPKLDALDKIINDRTSTVTHWLVFCEFTETVEFLSRKLTHPYLFTMTGETPMFDRESIVESFRKAPEGLLIVTSVGSEGLDFQFCGGIVNYDLHWNPMKLEQRAGRIDRVGQERKSIRIVNIHVANSVDDLVLSVIRRKLELISNSVFAPNPILSDHVHAPDARMYSEEVVAHELDAGSSLVETFKLNNSIETQDYAALPSVDTAFCDPTKLESAAPQIDASTIVRSEDWRKYVVEGSLTIIDLLKEYA